MKKNDLIVILAILLASAGIFCLFSKGRESVDAVQIFKDNALYMEVSLEEDKRIDIDGKNVVAIESGRVYVESADCPDQICVKQAPLTVSGRDIICLPNRVLVRLINKTAGADAVSG